MEQPDFSILNTNMPQQIAGSFSQGRRNALADLAAQQQAQMQGAQMRGMLRQEAAIPVQQAEAARVAQRTHGQEISAEIANRLKAGVPREQVLTWAHDTAASIGIPEDKINQHLLSPFQQTQDDAQLANFYLSQAYPEEAAKLQLAQQFGKSVVPAKPEFSATAGGYVEPPSEQYPQGRVIRPSGMTEKEKPEPLVIVVGPDGRAQYVPRSQAVGMQPYEKQKGLAATSPEQKLQASLSSQQVLDQAEKLFKHPGRAAGTGASSFLGAIPGTEAKGFQANLETFKSQTFLPMVSALKGMGALSDAEGKKITASVGALDPDMPEKEFEDSIKETTKFLFNKAQAAGLDVTMPDFAGSQSTEKPSSAHPEDIANILNKYK